MANSIALAQKFLDIRALDEVYRVATKTSMLDAPAGMIQDGMEANTIRIPQVALQGLGAYNRQTGFVDGNVTFSYQTHTFSQDRGRKFIVDRMDDVETIRSAFAALTSQFMRVHVAPEVDAYRFATLAGAAGNTATEATLSETTALEAIDLGVSVMADAEVPTENLAIFVTPEIMRYLKQSDLITRYYMTNVGTRMLNREIETLDGKPVIVVPQARFYTNITIYDGTTSGQEAGGYIKNATTGRDINFMIVDVDSMLGIKKLANPRIFSPDEYQDADAYAYDFRLYHDIFVPTNKANGIYLHNKTS